jgi:hypothetical protein
MKKIIVYIILLILPIINSASINEFDANQIDNSDLYVSMKLADVGLNSKVFTIAMRGLKKLENKGKLKNASIITIVDYSQSSNKKRLYVIDLKNEKLLYNSYVAHGKNSGEEFAKFFSNEEGSLKSSLGFYITQQTVIGATTGFALMINGVEKGFNNNAVKRSIIIHAAEYATEKFIKKNGRLGRSHGCPALPPELNKPIIETIKDGTCLFIYNPDNSYMHNSLFVN